MITVNFQFQNNAQPDRAARIQVRIREQVANDAEVDNTVDAIIDAEYTGHGALGLNMPLNIPIRSNTRIIELVFAELRDGGLIP